MENGRVQRLDHPHALALQLSRVRLAGRVRPIFIATVMRFRLGATIAMGVALLFGLQGMTRQVFI